MQKFRILCGMDYPKFSQRRAVFLFSILGLLGAMVPWTTPTSTIFPDTSLYAPPKDVTLSFTFTTTKTPS